MKQRAKRHKVHDPLLMHRSDGVVYTCAACSSNEHKFCSRYKGKAKLPCTCTDNSH